MRGRTKRIFCANPSPLASAIVRGAAEATGDSLPVLLFGIHVQERSLILYGEVADRGSVRPHDWFRASRGIRRAQSVEHRSIDEQRMTVAIAGSRPHDRRARPAVTLDHGADR